MGKEPRKLDGFDNCKFKEGRKVIFDTKTALKWNWKLEEIEEDRTDGRNEINLKVQLIRGLVGVNLYP